MDEEARRSEVEEKGGPAQRALRYLVSTKENTGKRRERGIEAQEGESSRLRVAQGGLGGDVRRTESAGEEEEGFLLRVTFLVGGRDRGRGEGATECVV